MAEGRIVERYLDEWGASARLTCPDSLLPKPGQYLLAHRTGSDEPLATPLFSAGNLVDGFLSASSLPDDWYPGTTLSLRGPFGHGFILPPGARKVALVAWDVSPAFLLGLIPLAREQGAGISLVCQNPPEDLPADIEIDPPSALGEISGWTDYMAIAGGRESIRGWRGRFNHQEQLRLPREAQALVLTPIPCGGMGKCGVCYLETKRGMDLVCEDGPVFQLSDVI
jgi:dihydroorotate dehydrogenase electron transfer subunit